MPTARAPDRWTGADAVALIGLTAVLAAHLLADDLHSHVADHLARRLGTDGPPELRLALADLTERLRYALGEYDQPPLPDTGQGEHDLGFGTQQAAHAFAGAVGDSAAEPVEVDGSAYDGAVRWQVAVGTSELPLSAAFDAEVDRLRSLAAEDGGSCGGWSSVSPR